MKLGSVAFYSFWLAILLCLGACTSAKEIAAKDEEECKSIGAQPGTQAYTDCRLRIKAMRQSETNARINAINGTTVCNSVGGSALCY